ncbi:MAG: (2Fe-2S)-binding protein [Lysobacterales bacterium]|jgi:carbon-monoxide dehydrogenase small subunit
MKQTIQFSLNGETVRLETEPDRPLLWVLRGDLALTGTKFGCGEGICGACTVLIGDSAVRSCVETVGSVAGKRITTIEGLAAGDELHPVQKAFVKHDALQCGYCTPGMVLTSVALLAKKPSASEAEIVSGLDANYCRCGAHKRILRAVREVAEENQA